MICYSLFLTAHPPQPPTRLQAWSPVASQCYISELLGAPAHSKPGYFLHSHKSVALDSNSSNKHLFEFPTYCRWYYPPLLDQGSGFVTSISIALLVKLLVKSPKKKKENSLAEGIMWGTQADAKRFSSQVPPSMILSEHFGEKRHYWKVKYKFNNMKDTVFIEFFTLRSLKFLTSKPSISCFLHLLFSASLSD